MPVSKYYRTRSGGSCQRRNCCSCSRERLPGAQLEGRTVAVVGFGRIGRRVAHLLLTFGAHVIAVDPAAASIDMSVELATIDAALPKANVVTLHASGEETILGATELSRVNQGALILNCGRAGLLDEGALRAALDAGRVAGAWVDTFDHEPYNGPLTHYPQVLLTPHVGSFTAECRRRMEMEAVDNLLDALHGDGERSQRELHRERSRR